MVYTRGAAGRKQKANKTGGGQQEEPPPIAVESASTGFGGKRIGKGLQLAESFDTTPRSHKHNIGNDSEEEEIYDSDVEAASQEPGAVAVNGANFSNLDEDASDPQPRREPRSNIDGAGNLDEVIQADLIDDPVAADVVDVATEEKKAVEKQHFAGLLIGASVFYILAIAFYIVGVVMNMMDENPWNIYAQIYAYTPAGCAVFIGTILYSISMCLKHTKEEKQSILRLGLCASISAILLLIIAGPLLWKVRIVLGFVLAMLSFAATVVALHCTFILLQTRERTPRQKLRSHLDLVFWIIIFLLLLTVGSWRYDPSLPIDDYPDCYVQYDWWIGDGTCDGETYATAECGWDDGDCKLSGDLCEWGGDCLSERCDSATRTCE